ncbi:TPA: DUF1120 domain-containing protein [Serratia marcescens]
MGKGIRLISCMVVLFAAAVSAAGMPNGELQVTGKMAAPRCEMIVPNNGVYDLGKIDGRALAAGETALPPQTLTWQVRCDRAVPLAVVPQDNRASMARAARGSREVFFSLGSAARPLGYYRLSAGQARIDRAAVALQTVGEPMARSGRVPLLPGVRTFAVLPARGAAMGQWHSIDITVSPVLGTVDAAAVSGEPIDGSATLEFMFAI